jgi:hypothetical protein
MSVPRKIGELPDASAEVAAPPYAPNDPNAEATNGIEAETGIEESTGVEVPTGSAIVGGEHSIRRCNGGCV